MDNFEKKTLWIEKVSIKDCDGYIEEVSTTMNKADSAEAIRELFSILSADSFAYEIKNLGYKDQIIKSIKKVFNLVAMEDVSQSEKISFENSFAYNIGPYSIMVADSLSSITVEDWERIIKNGNHVSAKLIIPASLTGEALKRYKTAKLNLEKKELESQKRKKTKLEKAKQKEIEKAKQLLAKEGLLKS